MITSNHIAIVAVAAGAVVSAVPAFTISDYLLFIGMLAFGVSSLRSGRMKLLRETNKDLTDRKDQLEDEKAELLARVAFLESQPNLEKHERLMDGMLSSLQLHDRRMQEATEQNQQAFLELMEVVKEIHQAVVPPRFIRDN